MTQSATLHSAPDSSRRQRPHMSLRVRHVAEGVVYHLTFEGDVQRLSGGQLRRHLAQICHIPPTEQQLSVRGAAFPPQALGSSLGLRQEDTVDLVRTSRPNGGDGADPSPPLSKQRRGQSAATVSSLRPSTNAGTMSPEAPYNVYNGTGGTAPQPPHKYSSSFPSTRQPDDIADHATSSVGSTATSNTRMAPSPERLIEGATPPLSQHYPPQPQPQQQRHRHRDSTQDDSQFPLWTSATSLSSLPPRRRDEGEGASPQPHVPLKGTTTRSSQPPYSPAQPGADRSHLDTSTHHRSSSYHRPSYEVPSPYEQQRRRQQQPPSQQLQHPQQRGEEYYPQAEQMPADSSANYPSKQPPQCGARNGLNQSRMDPVGSGSGSAGRPRRSSPPSSLPPPPPSSFERDGDVTQHRSVVPASPASPAARCVPVRADDLETLLDEQEYIWQMEDYRFRTERLNRLTALQNRRRDLTFEAARCDEALAEVSSQLQRERRKLTELQDAMSLHTASLNRFGTRNEEGLARASVDDVEDDNAAEVVEVDV
ncbi:hypothetical protein ABB37_02303 [Leptomonas pyrrhocoris]|uniref:Ubiquitin-like domain-containing protein n=1 Tax=Leptomonas pyrrhocoris TaxID=157538 RepID=A0A0N0DYK4_LEPPY|nr:hypothetical protein ABB37_02303 [Leptomonas pyrrhocoris]KPA84268.1 hypothetical protein ABB37_02303 [Leptomonas pyrrhocoris]|eukprot:XP_015662707.1 hypothetical protein ABB37_02303 [Leptomonas pyrrhocoris]